MFVFKDLGGIQTKNLKTIQKNRLLRSESLYHLRYFQKKKLEKHHLVKVIDLRTTVEKEEKPDTILSNVEYCHIPIFKEKMVGITHEKETDSVDTLKDLILISDLYKIMVTDEYSVSQIKKVIHEIIDSSQYSILFHCTAGKDRTGMIAMILLRILEVPQDVILKNYLEVNKVQKIKSILYYCLVWLKTKDKELASKTKSFFIADASYLQTALDAIDEKYGSFDSFLRDALEVTDQEIESFQKRVLE